MNVNVKNFLYFLLSGLLIVIISSLQKYGIIESQNNMALQMLGIAIISAIIFTIFAMFKKYKEIEIAIHFSFAALCIALMYSGSFLDIVIFILTMKMLIDVSIQIGKRKGNNSYEKQENNLF